MLLFSCQNQPNKPAQAMRTPTPDIPLSQILSEKNIDKNQLSIEIKKANRTLVLKAGAVVLKTYPMVLGGNPVGDKRREGDSKTPEGNFKIRNQYPHKKWSYFIWVDYPTQESQKHHQQSKRDGEIPQTATIGGEIGIHGVPAGKDDWIDQNQDWTLGCISLKNKHIKEVFENVKVGTNIQILP